MPWLTPQKQLYLLFEKHIQTRSTEPIYLLSVAACIAAAVVPIMEWKNIKSEAEDRRNRAEENLPGAIEQFQVNGDITKPE